ncbi:hypothetical protein IWQ60_005412 [Tieghemiomyces parasiticus]|uniref:Uncharacterized protein n=1 Tax=Tieghemiomyces parasiticus TaxID=78921 RepID=A0A9W8A660_9FUNG|nr:hypothetical protein IWQ60_005412 [Tieghemiomyces parasiticus]
MDEVGRHTPVIGTLGWPLAPTDHRQRSSSLTAELTSSWPTVRSGQSFSSSTAISDTPTLDHATVVRRGIEIAERWQVQDLDDLLLRKPYLDDPERSWVKCKFQIDEAMRGPYLVLRAHLPAVQYTSAATPSSGTGPNRLQGEDTRASLPPPAERAVYEVVYLPDTPLHDCRGQMERWAKASSQSTIRWVDMTNKVELMAVKYLLTIYPGNENQETVKETINGIQLRIDALRNPAKLMARF